MLSLLEVQRKLMVLNHYDKIFKGSPVRQQLPKCCGREYDIGELLQMEVRLVTVEVNDVGVMMFEVICPVCRQVVPPRWVVGK